MIRRVRVTLDGELLDKARRYAELAHMADLSGLVAEALEKFMRSRDRVWRRDPKWSPPTRSTSTPSTRLPKTMAEFKAQVQREATWYAAKWATLSRDDFTCQHCGRSSVDIVPHHIKRRRAGGPDDPANLITLCPKCHGAAHSKKGLPL